ncbi:MAG TPA: hypothetical protein VE733_02160 [Streptosporangiaceae bacterium]|nr:hypothetical protein [Streptosporangiaceae bacterium]
MWLLLWAWTVLWAAGHAAAFGYSWHYFAQGSRLLFGAPGGGLDLYATHPQLQIGPLTLAVAAPLNALGPSGGRVAATFLMTCTGPPLLDAIWRLVPATARRRSPHTLLWAGLIFLPVWTELGTHYGHLDDVLALIFGVGAMHAVARHRPVCAALLLAAATDAKPWAAGFAILLFAFPRSTWWRSLPVFAGAVAVAWLPFLAADPHSLATAQFTIPNSSASGLRALGVATARTPSWDRPAQLALGGLIAAIAVWRGRWPSVILLVTGARILLDPSVYPYYTSGVLVGTVAWDLATRNRYPWATITGAVALYAAHIMGAMGILSPHTLGLLRVAFVIGTALAVIAWPSPSRRGQRHRPAVSPSATYMAGTAWRTQMPEGRRGQSPRRPAQPHDRPGQRQQYPGDFPGRGPRLGPRDVPVTSARWNSATTSASTPWEPASR